MIRCQRHTQRGKAAGPRHQRDRQMTRPCSALGVPGRPRRQHHCRPTTPSGHQRSRPFSGGGRTSLDGPAPGQAGLQDPSSGQRGPERTANCGLLINSPGSPHLEDVEQAVQVSMLASVSESMTVQVPHAHLSHPPHQYRTRFPSKSSRKCV